MKLSSFIKECSEKEVFKRLSIYIVSSWVLIQVLAVVWQPLALPEKSVTLLIIILLIGFPVYLFLLWKYHLSPLEKKEDQLTKKGKKKRSKFQKTYYTFSGIISVLSLLSVFFITENAFSDTQSELATFEKSGKIGILQFGNNTGEVALDIVSKMTADWLTHGIIENKLGQVVSPEIVSDYLGIIKASEKSATNEAVLQKYFQPERIIMGNFYLDGSQLIFQSSITDGNIDKTLIAFTPVSCSKERPLECIESLKELVLGYLVTEAKANLNLQQSPPKFKAYQFLLDAKSNYANKEQYLDLLDKAIDEDPTFFEPKVLRVGYYYNNGAYQHADSLLRTIEPSTRDSKRQKNLLTHYEALLAGNNRKIYSTIVEEYNHAPFDMLSNSSTMAVAQQYVNRPRDVDSIFRKINMEHISIDDCPFCRSRYYLKALADLELKAYDTIIDFLKPIADQRNEFYLKRPIIAAYVRNHQDVALEQYVEEQQLVTTIEDQMALSLFAAKEFMLNDQPEIGQRYLQKIQALGEEQTFLSYQGEVAYYMADYKTAEDYLKKNYEENSSNFSLLGTRASCLYLLGKKNEANALLAELETHREAYQYGAIDYVLARYYAAIEDQKSSLNYLLKSIAAGNNYTLQKYQNDLHFKEYRALPEFQKIMNYWH